MTRADRTLALIVVSTAACLAATSALAVAGLGAMWPEQTAAGIADRADLLPLVAATGLLLGGALWAGLGLMRVARQASRWLAAASRELESGLEDPSASSS